MIKKSVMLGILSVMIFSSYLSYNFSSNAFAEEKAFTEILYSIYLGNDSYFIHFNACAGEKTIFSPSIILESGLDIVQIDSSKIIHENTCRGFESIIVTKSPEFVKITILE